MKETRKLSGANLRKLCINKNWYTCGTTTEYGKMLLLADNCKNVETSTIVKFAEDIMLHSDTDYLLESICFEIAAICHSIFEQEKIILTFDHEDSWGRAVFKGNNEKLYVTTNLIPRIGWEALDQEGKINLLKSLHTRTSCGEPNSPCWNEDKFCMEGVSV
jgi:hypothetical protein